MPEFSELLAGFRDACQGALDRFFEERRARARDSATPGPELVASIEDLVALGGKRVRPAILWFTHRACGGTHDSRALELAVACELLHTYLLIHDDIMDHAPVRRGAESAHMRFARLHRTEKWTGESAAYGEACGILAGDLAWSWSAELAQTSWAGLPSEHAQALARTFFGMTEEVIFGQHLEMRVAAKREASAEELARVIRLKSGCYTVERPMALGWTLASAPPTIQRDLEIYGIALGEAFQLVDDVLGVFGDPKTVGKPVGGDIREGKFTFLIHHALENAEAPERAALLSALGQAHADDATIQDCCHLVERLGARTAVEKMIRERLSTAGEALQRVEPALEPEGRIFFRGLIEYLGSRGN